MTTQNSATHRTSNDGQLIQSRSAFDAVLHQVSKTDFVFADTETSEIGRKVRPRSSALWDGRMYATGIGLGCDADITAEFYFPWRHESHNLPPEWLPDFKEALRGKVLVFHNALFDIAAWATLGISVGPRYFDTMVMAHMVNEEFPSKQLDWLAKFVLGDEGKDKTVLDQWLKILPWQEIPPGIMAPYCCKDVELCRRLFKVFYKEMSKVWSRTNS